MAQTFLDVLFLLSARAGIPPPELPAQFTLGDYEFIAPQGWQVQRQGTNLAIRNMESVA